MEILLNFQPWSICSKFSLGYVFQGILYILNNKLTELAGWYGVIGTLTAYTINSWLITNKFEQIPLVLLAIFLNVTASTGIIIDTLKDKNPQPIVINICWIIITLVSLVQILTK